MTKGIRKNANRGKTQDRVEKLKESVDFRQRWRSIKLEKEKQTPNFNKPRIPEVTQHPGSKDQRPQRITWKMYNGKKPLEPYQPTGTTSDSGDLGISDGPITSAELDQVLKELKSNKAPGPDS